jgi:NADH-quinone oxidoreductase subunit J
MNLATLMFWGFALASLLLAAMVVASRRILRSALYLTGVLLCGAVFYLLLGAEFLAGIQILVYIGGIVVLLVFTIMLTHPADLEEERAGLPRRLGALAASLAFFAVSALLVLSSTLDPRAPALARSLDDTTAGLGRQLLGSGEGGMVLPFELLSVLLLVAAVGGVYIARKTVSGPGGEEDAL